MTDHDPGDEDRMPNEKQITENDIMARLVVTLFELAAFQIATLVDPKRLDECRERGEFIAAISKLIGDRATQMQVPIALRTVTLVGAN